MHGSEKVRYSTATKTMNRGKILDKWHRACVGCGERHHINALKQMDGNECCPGEAFTRDTTKVKV